MLNELEQLSEQLEREEDHLLYCKSLFEIIRRMTTRKEDPGVSKLIASAQHDLILLVDNVIKLRLEVSALKNSVDGNARDELALKEERLQLLEQEYDKTEDLGFLPVINELRDEIYQLKQKQHAEFNAFKERVTMSENEMRDNQWSVREAINRLAAQMAEQNAMILKALSDQNQVIMQAMAEQGHAILQAIEAIQVEVEEVVGPDVLEEIELLESLIESEKPVDTGIFLDLSDYPPIPSTITDEEEAVVISEQRAQTTTETIMVERDRLLVTSADSEEVEMKGGFTLLPDEDEEEMYPRTVNLNDYCSKSFAKLREHSTSISLGEPQSLASCLIVDGPVMEGDVDLFHLALRAKSEEVDTPPSELTNDPWVPQTDPLAEEAWWSVNQDETVEVESVEVTDEAETYEPMTLEDATQYAATLNEPSSTPKTVVVTTPPTHSRDINITRRIYTTNPGHDKPTTQTTQDQAKWDINDAYTSLVNPHSDEVTTPSITGKINEIWEEAVKSHPNSFEPVNQEQMFDPPKEVEPTQPTTFEPVTHTDEDMQPEEPIDREELMLTRFNTNKGVFGPYTDSYGKKYNLYITKAADEVSGAINSPAEYFAKQAELLAVTGLRWFVPGREEMKLLCGLKNRELLDIPLEVYYLTSAESRIPNKPGMLSFRLIHERRRLKFIEHDIRVDAVSKDDVLPVRLIAREYI